MLKKETNQILVAEFEQTSYIRLIGRITFKYAPDFRQFILEQFDKNQHGVLIDFSDCETIDSTFIGIITSLTLKSKKENRKFIKILNVNEHIKRILKTLGLINILDIVDEKLNNIKYNNLPISSAGKIEIANLVLDAHETLSELNEKNVLEFKNVVTYLKKQISEQ